MASETYTTFYLNDQAFALDISYIREINRISTLTPVPHAPAFVRGLMNVRGQIVTIIDLKHRLGLSRTEVDERCHNIILKTDSELSTHQQVGETSEERYSLIDKVGLLVDRVREVITVSRDMVESHPGKQGHIEDRYILGVLKFDHELITLLNLKEILRHNF